MKSILKMAVSLCVVLSCVVSPNSLERKVTRLHILANSDSESDQLLKLKVRDSIIENTDILSGGYHDGMVDEELLNRVGKIARDTVKSEGFDYDVRVTYGQSYFDTRVYEGFAMPGGVYNAVKVEIGQAQGKNWWCVMFPPLCTPLAGERLPEIAGEYGLTEADVGVIMRENEGYVLRFKVLEGISALKALW